MPRIERTVTISNKMGLHARPSTKISEVANQYSCDVQLTKEGLTVDAKSVLELLMLAAECGSQVIIAADGEQAEEAVVAISELIESKFGELDVDQ
ncbi:MAG: HPr family phosphocarrier protein [Planctomycetota bacterium]|nr:MAG: HPr family phosphocarrier protein [Planctomycetota bacterium]